MESKNRHVVLTFFNMRPRKLGTVEEYCLFLSEALTRKGWKSVLVFIEEPPPWLGARFASAGACVEVASPPTTARSLQRLLTVVKKHRVDIFHATFIDIFSLATPLLKLFGPRHVVFSDQVSRTPPRRRSPVMRGMVRSKNRLFCRFIDQIVADAEFIRKDLIDKAAVDPGKVCVIYNGVNLERFHPRRDNEEAKARFGIPAGRRVVATVAKCIPEKGLDVFLRAAAEISRKVPEVTFLVAGDGPLLKDMRSLAGRLGIADTTVFLGLTSEVDDVLAASDVFVLCSLWEEAFAFTLLEAMAAGVPVVASRIGAIPESVAEGVTGLLFTPGDAGGAAGAITTLLTDDGLRRSMGRAGRERTEAGFGMGRWVNDTVRLYERIL